MEQEILIEMAVTIPPHASSALQESSASSAV
jgi:hypothetical protein